MLVLMANNLTFGEHRLHDQFDADLLLIDEALAFVEKTSRDLGHARLQKLHAACCELNSRAVAAAMSFRQGTTWRPQTLSWSAGLENSPDFLASYIIDAFTREEVKLPTTKDYGLDVSESSATGPFEQNPLSFGQHWQGL